MKLSKRGEYGLRVMVDLASTPSPGALVQAKEIA